MIVNSSSIAWVASSVLAAINKLAIEKFPLETGGLLMGYIAANGDYVISDVIGPGPNAIHREQSFIPDNKYQQANLEDKFLSSRGKITYLGDWHTHPKGVPFLSRTDKETLRQIALTPTSRIAHPLMLVMAISNENWTLGIYTYNYSSGFSYFRKYFLNSLNYKIFD